MNTVLEIERAISALSPNELDELYTWMDQNCPIAIRLPDEYLWFWIGEHNVYDAVISWTLPGPTHGCLFRLLPRERLRPATLTIRFNPSSSVRRHHRHRAKQAKQYHFKTRPLPKAVSPSAQTCAASAAFPPSALSHRLL